MGSQAGGQVPRKFGLELLLPEQEEDTETGVPAPEWEGEELLQGLHSGSLSLSDLSFSKRRSERDWRHCSQA